MQGWRKRKPLVLYKDWCLHLAVKTVIALINWIATMPGVTVGQGLWQERVLEQSGNCCIMAWKMPLVLFFLLFVLVLPPWDSYRKKKKIAIIRCPASNKRRCWWIEILVFPDLFSHWLGQVTQPFSLCLLCIFCKVRGWRVKSGNFTRKLMGKLRYLYLQMQVVKQCIVLLVFWGFLL